MQILRSRIFWGAALVIGGILILMQSLNIFPGGDLFWAAAFIVGGGIFFSVFLENRVNWWALIPGTALAGIGLNILFEAVLPHDVYRLVDGVSVLLGIGLGFWLVYAFRPSNWWAIIPAGVLTTLAVVDLFDQINLPTDLDTGGIFFLGLGATFALLPILPPDRAMLKWAYIPALILTMIGCFTLVSASHIFNYIWPAVLILLGAVLLYQAVARNR